MDLAKTGERVCKLATVAVVAVILIGVIGSPKDRERLREKIGQPKRAEELRPGEVLPPIEVRIISPRTGYVTISQPETEWLLLFYSGRCAACKESWQIWNSIADSAKKLRDIQVLALSVLDEESTRKELASRADGTTVGLFTHTASSAPYKIHRLPAVVYIRNCKVVDAWHGAIGQEQRAHILRRIAASEELHH